MRNPLDRAAAIASLARTTDFVANPRPVDWVITYPNEVKLKTDTMTRIMTLKINIFTINIENQELKHLCSAYCVASRRIAGCSPHENEQSVHGYHLNLSSLAIFQPLISRSSSLHLTAFSATSLHTFPYARPVGLTTFTFRIPRKKLSMFALVFFCLWPAHLEQCLFLLLRLRHSASTAVNEILKTDFPHN